jgi:hypothetical protein
MLPRFAAIAPADALTPGRFPGGDAPPQPHLPDDEDDEQDENDNRQVKDR